MSIVDSKHDKNYVVTYKELIFTFAVFVIILVVLYPKDMLKEQILSEKSNYDLSMLYLKNLLKHEPENESLMLILAEQSLRTGKTDLSLRLLNLLLKSRNVEYRQKAMLLSYELKKDNYYYFKDAAKQVKAKEELRKLLILIFYGKMYDENDIEKWHHEAVFIGDEKIIYYFLKQRILKDPTDAELLESGYYLSIKLNRSNDSAAYVKLLINNDMSQHERWLLDEYYMLINAGKYAKVEKILQRNVKESSVWKNRSAEYYLMRKSYIKSSNIYVELLKQTKDYKEKRAYLFKAINALQAGNYLKKSADLGHKYQQFYINDKVVRKYLLKVYIATGNLEYASSLAEKILKKETR